MKLLDNFFRRNRARDGYIRGKDSFVSRWARPPSRNTREWLETFWTSPRLAVVDRIASDIANVPGHLFQINRDGTETELTSHPFLDFMNEPNPLYEMTSAALWRLHEIYLMLVGESFFLIERDANDKPIELWNVPPRWVSMTPYLGSPYYTIMSPGGLTMTVPVDDIFVMKQLNPLDPFMRGLGIAESIADEVEIDEYAAKFQKRFFYNDATPPVVFLMPEASAEQRDAFMAQWNKKHRGVEHSHTAAALSGNVTVKEIGGGANYGKNLGFLESRIAMRDAVLEHFGVPREIMGITENSNRATADSAQYIYAKNVLMPRIRNREEAINKQLLPLFGYNLVWRFDAVVPYDKEFDKSKALDAYNAGLVTKDEARAMLDLPEIDGGAGKVFKVSTNDVFLNETENPVEAVQDTAQKGVAVAGQKSAQRVDTAGMLRRKSRAIRKNEQLFKAVITQHFDDQRATIAKALGLKTKATGHTVLTKLEPYILPDGTFDPAIWEELSEEERERITDETSSDVLDWEDEAKKLLLLLLPLWGSAYDDGVSISEDTYKLIRVIRPDFASAARVNGAKRVAGIEETTRKNIADIIANGFANGSSQDELARAIMSEMGSTEARAKLIAHQETAMAIASGEFDMMLGAGANFKTWHHMDGQPNPRDGTHGKANHVILEGETVPIDELFSNGMRYPQDPDDGRPEEVINCHCYLTYGGF